MALPTNGPISFLQIMQELGTDAKDLESLINLSNLSDQSRPHSMSQFHGYEHFQEPVWYPKYSSNGCFTGNMYNNENGFLRPATSEEMETYYVSTGNDGNPCPLYAIE